MQLHYPGGLQSRLYRVRCFFFILKMNLSLKTSKIPTNSQNATESNATKAIQISGLFLLVLRRPSWSRMGFCAYFIVLMVAYGAVINSQIYRSHQYHFSERRVKVTIIKFYKRASTFFYFNEPTKVASCVGQQVHS